MPVAAPEERALVTLIAEAESAGRREEAWRLYEEKRAMARKRLGIPEPPERRTP